VATGYYDGASEQGIFWKLIRFLGRFRKTVRKSSVSTLWFLALLTGLYLLAAMPVFSQSLSSPADLSQKEVDRIINTFTAKESQFRKALNEYSFKRDAILQSIGMGGQVTGEYHRVSYFTFDDSGNRYEKINYFPMPSFGAITQEDLNDLGGIQPFALEPAKISQYDFRYVGREKIDELNLFVFDVNPKILPDAKKTKERFFKGRVWVEDQDFQIVKTKGKGLPETKNNKFPTVETYREQIDGRYWFPTYSYADDELVFENGATLHVRMKVRYSDFVKATGKLKVIEIESADAPKETKPVTPPPRKP
jgi:hypothetical protein